MKLGKQPPKRKHSQAMDLVASMAKTWSEWHLAKRAGEGVRRGARKAADLRPGRPSGLKRAVTGKRAKLAGAVAVVGGLGAVARRKMRGDGGVESYTPPAPHEPSAAPPPPPPPPPSGPPPPPPQPTAAPSPTASAIVHDAAPPPTLQAAPPPDAEVVSELEEPVEKIEMPDANLLTEEPAATAEADEPEADAADTDAAGASETDADAAVASETDGDESEDAEKA